MEQKTKLGIWFLFNLMIFYIGFNTHYILDNQPIPVCEGDIINLTCPKAEYSCNIPELSCPKPFCDVTCQSCKDNIILDPIKYISQREYIYDEYDCTEMSDDAVDILQDIGWTDAKRIKVKKDCSKLLCTNSKYHDIVKMTIYVDAERNVVIHPNEYKALGIEE